MGATAVPAHDSAVRESPHVIVTPALRPLGQSGARCPGPYAEPMSDAITML
jgi:hypothetical protein